MSEKPLVLRVWQVLDRRSWMLAAPPHLGGAQVIGCGTKRETVWAALRLAVEYRSVIQVVDADKNVIEAYESIDCREAVEDGLQARGVVLSSGRIRHVVTPLDPTTLTL